MFYPVLGFAASFFIFGDTRRFFEVHAKLFWFGFHQLGDHALLNDGVAARTKSGAKKDVLNVTAAAARPV